MAPYNGSGDYTAPSNSWNPAVGGTTIDSADWNSTQQDYETALSQVITKDGQTTITANLPMSGFKHTGVNPNSGSTSRTEYASGATAQDNIIQDAGDTAGTSTAYTATLTPAIAAYADKQCFRVKFNAACGSNPTINFNSVGAKKIYKNVAGTATQLVANDVYANFVGILRYDTALDSAAGGFWLLNQPTALDTVYIETITAGENLADRDIIYKDIYNARSGGADRWYKVDTNATAPVYISPVIGISLAAITSGNTGSACVRPASIDGFSGLTNGQAVYASTTAGGVTQTVPAVPSTGTQVAIRYLGDAISTTEIAFNPEPKTMFVYRNSALASASSVTVEHYTDSGSPKRVPNAFVTSSVNQIVSGGTGTAIGNMTGGGGLAASFDGTTSKTQGASSLRAASSGNTVGKDWGSGNTKTIGRYIVYAPNNGVGFVDGAGNVTITLQGSTDNFSGSTVQLHTSTFAAAASQVINITSGIDTSTAYRYHRIVMSTDGSTTNMYCAQLVFYDFLGTVQEPVTIASETIASAETTVATVQYGSTTLTNPNTNTTFYNRTGATRDFQGTVTV